MVEIKLLWAEIGGIVKTVGQECWVVLGDFNEVLHTSERLGLGDMSDAGPIDFRSVIEAIGLYELLTIGGSFT